MCQVNVDIINMGEEEANTDLLNKFIGRMPMSTLFIIVPSMPTPYSKSAIDAHPFCKPNLCLQTFQT